MLEFFISMHTTVQLMISLTILILLVAYRDEFPGGKQ